MYQVSFTQNPNGFHIEGYPNAVKFAQPPDDLSKAYAHLWLHYEDLHFAHQCLSRLAKARPDDRILVQALWHSALVATFKCFQFSKARESLIRDNIYESGIQHEVFDYLKNIRNKTVVHDENDWRQVLVGAVINRPSEPSKVEAALCFALSVGAPGQTDITNLGLVVERAIEWVQQQFDTKADSIVDELNTWSYDELTALPDAKLDVPTAASVGNTRTTPRR